MEIITKRIINNIYDKKKQSIIIKKLAEHNKYS
jgi:hypothetical protein